MSNVKYAKTIIFDFDGTIADSFGIFIEAIEGILKRPQKLSSSEIDILRECPTIEILKMLGVKKWQVPLCVIKGRRVMTQRMDRVDIFEDMDKVIKTLSEKHNVYIVTTNSEDAVTGFLSRYYLSDDIDGIYAGGGIQGKAKRIKKLIQKEGLDARHSVYVGDESRDIIGAKSAGIRCIAVDWGYAKPNLLEQYKPDALISSPSEIEKFVRLKL